MLLRYDTADLRGSFLDSTEMIVTDVVGSLSSGEDAQLTAGGGLRVRVQNTVQKGDVDGNDAVDISDLVSMIDHIVGRHHLDPSAAMRADIAPWPVGDSNVDVRDLVLTQNVIVTGAYPDGTPLNALPRRRLESLAADAGVDAAPDVKMTIYLSNVGIVVQMDNAVQVKGVQLELNNILAIPDTLQIRSSFGSGSCGLSSNVFRVLMYNDSGLPLEPGVRYLSWMLFDIAKPLNVNLKKLIVADVANNAITNMQVSIVYGWPVDGVGPRSLSESIALEPNSPNPFSTQTMIAFSLPTSEGISVSIHSLNGALVRRLASGTLQPGRHTMTWDGRDDAGLRLPAGMYLCSLTSRRYSVTRRIVFIP